MATFGSLNGNNLPEGDGSYLDWQLTSQNNETNKSTINWQAGWRFPYIGCRGLRLGTAIINGVTVWNDLDGGDGVHAWHSGADHRPKLQTAAGSLQIEHDTDGTKTFNASITITGWHQGGPTGLSSGSTSWELPTIPRYPAAPTDLTISNVTPISVDVNFIPVDNGSPEITAYILGYGTNPEGPSATLTIEPEDTIAGLVPGTTYYFWVRAQNEVGLGPWSEVASASTPAGARFKDDGVYKVAVPYVKDQGVWKVAKPFVKSGGTWKTTT